MPTLRRRPVPLTPLPDQVVNGTLSGDAEVFYLQATGEIFLDYESYSNRIAFYLQKIFSDEATGRTGLDFYTALNCERRESEQIQQRFPAALKGRLLKSAQFQTIGRLDSLVDVLFERYKDRYFVGETVTVEGTGDKVPCAVVAVMPPPRIVQILTEGTNLYELASGGDPHASRELLQRYADGAHIYGTDLNMPIEDVLELDGAEAYRYSVAPVQTEGVVPGSTFEVTNRQLSRDRLGFSKTIFKRYLKECLSREPGVGNAWHIKPRIAKMHGLPYEEPEAIKARNATAKTGALAKRKKAKEEYFEMPDAKRLKPDEQGMSTRAIGVAKVKAKNVKYPVEDLFLEPWSIFDGRALRKGADAPPLPQRPKLLRDLPCDTPLFDDYIQLWNMLNIFGWPLALSNFTLDEFDYALKHDTLTPRCGLLAEIHGCLLTIITSDGHRVPNTSAATASGTIPPFIKPEPDSEEAQITQQEKEIIVRQCLEYSRKWDRSKRLTTANARLGWERHLIGCLIQRGGIETIPGLLRILKHLMSGYKKNKYDAESATPAAGTPVKENGAANGEEPDSPLTPPPPSATNGNGDDEDGDDDDDNTEASERDEDGPPQQYLSLPLADKLSILKFLMDLVLNSRAIRAYIDACENALTELRKEKIEVNRDRRNLVAEKAALEGVEKFVGPIGVANGSKASTPAPDANGASAHPTPEPSINGDADESILAAEDGSEVDELASDPGDANATTGNGVDIGGPLKGGRQAALREKAMQKQAQEAMKVKEAATKKNTKNSPSKPEVSDRQRIAESLANVEERDALIDREFRRHRDVLRVKPLGKDRFFNRYWYFDGIGTMELISSEDGSVVYGTGRLFVQGPSREDEAYSITLASEEGAEGLASRRLAEEGANGVLKVDEWAYIEDDEEIEVLLGSLNAKGNREHNLRNAIKEFRPYITAGITKRKQDLGRLPRDEPQEEEGHAKNTYLTWTNAFAYQVMLQNRR